MSAKIGDGSSDGNSGEDSGHAHQTVAALEDESNVSKQTDVTVGELLSVDKKSIDQIIDISSDDENPVNKDSIASLLRDSESKSKRMKTIDSHLSSHLPKVRVNVENVVNKTNDNNISRPPQQEMTREKYNIMVANYEKNLKYRDQCIEELQQKLNDKEKSEENLKQLLETKNQLFANIGSKFTKYCKSKAINAMKAEQAFRGAVKRALEKGLENDTIPVIANK